MPTEPRTLSYIRAINEALRWALTTYPESILFGEDVAIPGGPFGASKGLLADFGSDRVFDTPISEAAMVGLGLGGAWGGLRPIVEIMYGDFLLVAMDQIVNQVANARYASNGLHQSPLTIRTQQGSTPGSCAQHSQSLEAFYAHVPGLRVAIPSCANDAYQLLRTAIASQDPVLVLESRQLYPSKEIVELAAEVADIGGARVVRTGEDITLVSWGSLLPETLRAADDLAAIGVRAEVIDLRWASPIDHDTIATSAAKTTMLCVAHEANRTAGLGAEIVATAAERIPGLRVTRVGAPDIRIPAAPTLSAALLPNRTTISAAVRLLVG